jgi:hypothetical protein
VRPSVLVVLLVLEVAFVSGNIAQTFAEDRRFTGVVTRAAYAYSDVGEAVDVQLSWEEAVTVVKPNYSGARFDPVSVGDPVEVFGERKTSFTLVYLSRDDHYLIRSQVCSEGAVNVLEMCPDGSTWSHMQVCRNNAWVDEYQQCPTPTPTCSGGQYWNGQQCVCPSGQQWNGQQCVTPTPTCSDGQYWDGSQCVCPSGQEWNGQQCVTPSSVSWQREVKNLYEQPLPKLIHWIIEKLKEKDVQPFSPQYVNAQIDITLSTGQGVDYVKIVTDQEFCGVIPGGSTQSQKKEGFAGKMSDTHYRAIVTCLYMSTDDYIDLALYVMSKLGVPDEVARLILEVVRISTSGRSARAPPAVHADVEVSVAGVLYEQPEREPPLPAISDVAEKPAQSGSSSTAGSILVGASPIAIMIADPIGRRVGALCENGQFTGEVNEISGAYYSGYDSEPQMILVPGSSSPTSVIVCGKDTGEYTLVAATYESGNGAYQSVTGSVESGQVNAYAVETSSDRTKMQIRRTDSSSGQQDIVLTLTSAVVTAAIVLVSSEILLRRQRIGTGMGRGKDYWRESVRQGCPGCSYKGHIPQRNGVGECPSCHRKIYYS